jgi:hypothetical protein
MRFACIVSDDMVASTSFASMAMRCADARKRWKVITGSQTALIQIGEAFAHYFGTGGIISGL